MLRIASQTAGPIGLKLFVDTQGCGHIFILIPFKSMKHMYLTHVSFSNKWT